jgi:hypothetical protein
MNLHSPFALTIALLLSLLPSLSLWIGKGFQHSVPATGISFPKKEPPLPEISFPTPIHPPEFPAEKAKAQCIFSQDLPHPMAQTQDASIHVHFAGSQNQSSIQSKQIGLQWNRLGSLELAPSTHLFWLEVEKKSPQGLIASLFYVDPEGKTHCGARWEPVVQEALFQSFNDISEGNPFRELARGSFGVDLLAEKYGAGSPLYRVELGSVSYFLKPGDWLVFKEKQWQPLVSLEKADKCPIARAKTISLGFLEMEGWEEASYVRLQLPMTTPSNCKTNGDELLTQLRVRSEKQISCMLDKQCLVLRAGDWVVKTDQRWKIVRKAEEKNLLLQGKIKGDLLVLDRIDAKGLSKRVAAHYFSSNHLQAIPIEKSVSTARRR